MAPTSTVNVWFKTGVLCVCVYVFELTLTLSYKIEPGQVHAARSDLMRLSVTYAYTLDLDRQDGGISSTAL